MIVWWAAAPLSAALLVAAIVFEVRDARRGVPSMTPTWCAVGMILVWFVALFTSVALSA